MSQNVIVIICDCDGTLCPDTTDRLVSKLGLDLKEFWKDVSILVEDGWDPPLAYLNRLLELSKVGQIKPLTRQMLISTANTVKFYTGALDFIDRLKGRLNETVEYREAGIALEWYVVSSGIEELLKATSLGSRATEIFGCAFEYDTAGRAVAVKRAVTFTEKTKFVFAINKGISGEEILRKPYRVNDAVSDDDRRVSFQQMVYIGDGPSDIPCFSMIKKLGGRAIGVMPPEDLELRRPYELAEGERLTVGPYTADFSDGSDLFKILWRIVESIADSIVEKRAQSVRTAPSH